MNPQDFISQAGTDLAESLNEQIITVAIDLINEEINLDQIIQDDKDKRLKDFQEAYDSCKDEDIKLAMVYDELSFNNLQDKFKYAFSALLDK